MLNAFPTQPQKISHLRITMNEFLLQGHVIRFHHSMQVLLLCCLPSSQPVH